MPGTFLRYHAFKKGYIAKVFFPVRLSLHVKKKPRRGKMKRHSIRDGLLRASIMPCIEIEWLFNENIDGRFLMRFTAHLKNLHAPVADPGNTRLLIREALRLLRHHRPIAQIRQNSERF